MKVTIVGAGVIGLSIAHELALAGDDVTVISDAPSEDTVSAIAGAIWFISRVESSVATSYWAARTFERLMELSTDPSSGVFMREGTWVQRAQHQDREWTTMVSWYRDAFGDELPPGLPFGVRTRLPVITMSRYLPWLVHRCRAKGVGFAQAHVSDLNKLVSEADLAVVAAGLGSGRLLGDDSSMYPVRGQIVRVANPGISGWVIDGGPGGRGYVFPREDDIVLGGSSDIGEWDTTPDPALEARILERTAELVPALRGLPILSRAVGLRPARDSIRLELISGHSVPVIACYGHGGAGVTLSWGCAEQVATLVGEQR